MISPQHPSKSRAEPQNLGPLCGRFLTTLHRVCRVSGCRGVLCWVNYSLQTDRKLYSQNHYGFVCVHARANMVFCLLLFDWYNRALSNCSWLLTIVYQVSMSRKLRTYLLLIPNTVSWLNVSLLYFFLSLFSSFRKSQLGLILKAMSHFVHRQCLSQSMGHKGKGENPSFGWQL